MKTARDILLWVALLGGALCAVGQSERKVVRRDGNLEYPEVAVKVNLHGAVRLKIWITNDGSVRRLDYVGGHPLLAEAALKAVKRWKFEPAGQETTQVVEVKF